MEPKLTNALLKYTQLKEILAGYKRSQILEVYFARLDGRENSNPNLAELYSISMEDLKIFLSGKFQQDPLLQQLSKINSLVLESTTVNF